LQQKNNSVIVLSNDPPLAALYIFNVYEDAFDTELNVKLAVVSLCALEVILAALNAGAQEEEFVA
jgi:hypothetical protein